MLKKSSPVLALCLIISFFLPSNTFAGHLGLFRRCCAKPKCCGVNSCPTEVVSTSTVTAVPVTPARDYLVKCYVKATAIGMNSMGVTCTSSSLWIVNEDCGKAKEEAITKAKEGLAADCILQRIVCDAVPQQFCVCCQNTAFKTTESAGCQYKVTYKLWCCNSAQLEYTAIDPDLEIAKLRAKDAACFLASLECGGKVRCCRWEICQIPAAAN
jgi:hypothetical protein